MTRWLGETIAAARARAMNEAEWLASDDPAPMLAWLTDAQNAAGGAIVPMPDHPGARKVRLFACACCRGVWHLLTDERSRNAVEVAERFADGMATDKERRSARGTAMKVSGWVNACGGDAAAKANGQVQTLLKRLRHHARQTSALQAALLREVVGNPFRPVNVSDLIDGGTRAACDARAVAASVYAERNFAELPIVADAMEDAGCVDAAVLAHLRSAGPHVRGCWALDLILGKS